MPAAPAATNSQLATILTKATKASGIARSCEGTLPGRQTGQVDTKETPRILRYTKTHRLEYGQRRYEVQNAGTLAKTAGAVIVLFIAVLTGCGGSGFNPSPSRTTTGFDSRTSGGATDSQLQALWQQAQKELATQVIPLNPVAAQMQGGDLVTIAPDPRASGVQPQGVVVTVLPDLTVAQLQAENPGVQLRHNTDPTGVIHCPEGALAKYCCAFTASNNQGVYVATSQVLNFDATGWEFENVILARLGYNTAGR